MLRILPIKNAKAALAYYSKSDGGYFVQPDDLHREWGGKAAVLLGLFGPPKYEQFERLIQGQHPETGEKLSSGRKDANSLAGWDINVHCSKGVTIALERGDTRIHDALWEAAREAMADIEQHATTRVRKGGVHDNRITGNLVWYGVEHPETRPAKEDGMPDPHRHIHFVVANATFDREENEWKALKVRKIMELRKFFDRRFEMRFAHKLAALGYEIETKWKADARGRKYVGWDIRGIPQTVIEKFSRRSAEVEEIAKATGIRSPLALDKLGATSRQHKRDDMTLADYRRYWDSRVDPSEAREVAETIKAAVLRAGWPVASQVDDAVAFAMSHEFERASVLPWEKLAVTAMERSMGAGLPDEIMPEAVRQGALMRDGLVTTKDVLAEESRMIAFAVAGKGTMRPLGDRLAPIASTHLERGRGIAPLRQANAFTLPHPLKTDDTATLSTEQQAVIQHLLTSQDRVMLIRGAAGTGKTTLTKSAVARMGVPVTMLAPTTPAVDVLRKDGFEANTLARFLLDERIQATTKNGVIWLDEAGLVGTKSMASLFELADRLNARVVLMGDKRQLASVERGSPLRVLEDIAKLPVAEVSDIKRQSGEYKEAVKLLAKGEAPRDSTS